MKNIIKLRELLIYITLAIAFMLLALLGNWDSFAILNIIAKPFEWIGSGIRSIGENALTYILYIVLCLLPLIFPLIRIIKTKKILTRNLIWIILSAYMFIMLYFFINPHKLQFALSDVMPDESKSQFQGIALIGISITFYAILIFCLLFEFYFMQKKDDKKIYLYAKILFLILIVGILADIFFFNLLETRLSIAALPKNTDFENPVNINKAVNVFVIILSYLIKLLPAFFTVLLFLQSKAFIGDMQSKMFVRENVPKLKSIIKSCVITVFVTLLTMIAQNLICLILSGKLLNVYYNLAIPLGMILAACLIMIFSKILIKAIEINEENKLVI